MLKIFARNFRGFRKLDLDLQNTNFLVGDNSSGKSSIMHLVDCVLRGDLNHEPRLDEELAVDRFDFFSPYFNYEDVTLGYIATDKGNFYSKTITMRKTKLGFPEVIRCSYFVSGLFINIKKVGNKLYYKTSGREEDNEIESLLEMHHINSGYKNLDKFEAEFSVYDPVLLFSMFERDDVLKHNLAKFLMPVTLPTSTLTSPVRGLPEKYYNMQRKISALGTHFASMWHDMKQAHRDEGLKNINSFGSESKLFEKLNVNRIQKKLVDSPLSVSITKRGIDFSINQMGVGISQVLPVLVEIIFNQGREGPHVFCLQQPELHLHPIAQAALGTFLFKTKSTKSNFMIETHSTFLIDRYRANFRDLEPDCEDRKVKEPRILFCENTEEGNICHEIVVSSNGQLVGEPDIYHDFFVQEYMKTLF